jgi:hypothetical protein
VNPRRLGHIRELRGLGESAPRESQDQDRHAGAHGYLLLLLRVDLLRPQDTCLHIMA